MENVSETTDKRPSESLQETEIDEGPSFTRYSLFELFEKAPVELVAEVLDRRVSIF